MKWKKLGSIGNKVERYNTLCIGKVMGMSMTNRSQNWGCLIQMRQWKTIKQGVWVKIYKKERGKIPFWQFKRNIHSNFKQMSSQITNNNNYVTAPAFPNLYITRKLNNMDEAKAFKKEWDDWIRLYHTMLKGIEVIIDIQEKVQDMIKTVGETHTTIIEIRQTILQVSINNWTMNATNILEISEDLQYLI